MKLKGPYGETLKAYQPNSKNSWSQMFPLSPYTPKPPKQQPAKYVPTTNLKSELSRSADQLRQYLGPPPTTATSSVIRIGQSKVPTRSFATQTTIKNKKHAAAVQTPTDWIENMERLIEFFLESIQETEEAKRQLLLHEEEQALSDVTEDHVQFLMSQASSPRSQELSPTKPKNNGVRNLILMLNADEEMRRRKIVHHWDRNKNIHVWMQTEIHRLQLQELEFAETEARVAIEMEDPVEYNIISQWQARDYKRCKQRDEAAQVINRGMKCYLAHKTADRLRAERTEFWDLPTDANDSRQMFVKAKYRSAILQSKYEITQLQYSEEDGRELIEGEEWTQELEVARQIVMYLEMTMRSGVTGQENQGFGFLMRKIQETPPPPQRGGPQPYSHGRPASIIGRPASGRTYSSRPGSSARPASSIGAMVETCEEEEMQSRTGIETLESIWRDMLATQRFEGLNRNWIWEDEVEARSATFTKNVHVAEEDARDLVMQQEEAELQALQVASLESVESVVRQAIEAEAQEPYMWNIYPYVRRSVLTEERDARTNMALWMVQDQEAIRRADIRHNEGLTWATKSVDLKHFDLAGEDAPNPEDMMNSAVLELSATEQQTREWI
jgi:NACalpha-BTF3-like transcription factor